MRHNRVSSPASRRRLLRAILAPDAEFRRAYESWRTGGPPSLEDLSASERALLPQLESRSALLQDRDADRTVLRKAFLATWTQNLRLVTAAVPAIAALEAAGTPVLLLKGAALAFREYASPGLRPMNDVDLLVPARCAAQAREFLEAAGFVPAERHGAGFLESIHGLAFRGPDGLEVDLHWHAVLERPEEGVDRLLFDGAGPVALPGLTALAPSPEAHLLLVAVHAQRWSAVSHLVGFADAAVLLRRASESRLVDVLAAGRELGLAVPIARTLAELEAARPGTVPRRAVAVLAREEAPPIEELEALLRRRPPGLLAGLALHWLAHRRATPGASAAERIGSFPRRLRRVWGIDRGSLVGEALRRSAARVSKRGRVA